MYSLAAIFRKKSLLAPFLIFGIGFLFRVTIVFTLGDLVSPTTCGYGEIDPNIVSGNGFAGETRYSTATLTAFKAPACPYLLAVIYKLFGSSCFLVIEMIQAFWGDLTSVVVYLIALNI